MEGTLAVVTAVAYNFAPKYWALCNGQTLPINQNQALFSLLGTTFGGDGRTTFGLPNLMGRTPVGLGTLQGGASYTWGEVTGSETATLTVDQMPAHVHNGQVNVTPRASNAAEDNSPVSNFPGPATNGYANNATSGTTVNGPKVVSTTIGMAGGSMPFKILTPYTVLNFVICTAGIFPSRN